MEVSGVPLEPRGKGLAWGGAALEKWWRDRSEECIPVFLLRVIVRALAEVGSRGGLQA